MFAARTIPNQQPNEVLHFFLRRHPIAFLKNILFFLLEITMGVGVAALILNTVPNVLDNDLASAFLMLLASAYALLVWLLFFNGFLDYYLDTWIVTNIRIINIEQRGLFSRVRSEQSLSRIQDVTADVKGFFPTILRFGTVYVQTAGAQERITMKQVRNPEHVARTLIDLIESSKHNNSTQQTL